MSETLILRLEDALIIAGIFPLWLPILGYRGWWVWLVLAADLLFLAGITFLRIRRMVRLYRQSQTLAPFKPPEDWQPWKK